MLLGALLIGLPGGLVALVLLWTGDFSPKLQWTLTLFVVGFWLVLAVSLRQRVVRPLQTISNLLAALREGDYSIRAHTPPAPGDTLAEIGFEINALERTLRDQRLGAVEATALFRRVIDVIDVAIFAFDQDEVLRLVNRAGETLMARSSEQFLGRSATDLALNDCLAGDSPRTVQIDFPGKSSRWGVRRSTFREGGRPHQLLALADLSQALREEERQAWQRLVRVLGHELNNSLAPIKSTANSLATILASDPRPSDWESDVRLGLNVINSRTDSLNRFVQAYARLARLPRPKLEDFALAPLVRRVAKLEDRVQIAVEAGPSLRLRADPTQLEQLLINLLRNAADAVAETGGGVRVGWSRNNDKVQLWVQDDGPGLASSANLFVPFFTTKPHGTGIGLVLCRQIAEGHGGSLSLRNRADGPGCEARLELPA